MWAAAGIIVPLAIHLWNIRQGKILKVGSIAFLTESSKNYATSLKLTELLLLLMRCLLIMLLAALLSKPRWDRPFLNPKIKGWVLIEKENLSSTYARFKPFVDSLLQAGYEFHYFNDGFKKDNLRDVAKDQNDPVVNGSLSYRFLLKKLDRLVPAELPIHLFTTNYLNRQEGKREAVSLNLYWHTYTPADSTATFISKAFTISADSIRIILGNTQPSGTTYLPTDIDIKKNTNPDLSVSTNNGRLLIAYQKYQPVEVDTAALNITIFTSKYFTDAAYIKAAAETIRQFSRHRISVLLVNKIEGIPAMQDWLFWLSEMPVPASLKANNIFRYEGGEAKKISSWIVTKPGMGSEEEKIFLSKSFVLEEATDPLQIIWEDGFGNPILSLEKAGTNTYHLFTRFDPSWNDLPWSDQFPQLVFTLLFPREKTGLANEPDKRIISEQQLLPANNPKELNSTKEKFITTDISFIFWLLVFLAFFIERIIALRNRKEVVYG